MINLSGTVVWETTITFEDPDLYRRIMCGDLPTYEVFRYPLNKALDMRSELEDRFLADTEEP